MSTNDPYQTNDYVPAPPPLQDDPSLGEYFNRPWPQPPNTTHVTGWPVPQQPQPTNGLAVAALVLGIVWAFWIGSVLAIVFGHVALGQIRQRNQSGKGMAVAGLVLGYVGAGMFALFVVLPLLLGAGA
jgi:hypothetical protein